MEGSLGDFAVASVLDFRFTSRKSTGLPTQLAGSPAIQCYKDNGTTQSTAGLTLTVDFDSVTGLNHVRVDTSADGTFYSAGSVFDIVLSAGTVDSVSVVGEVVGRFSLEKTSALRATVAGRTLDVSAGGEAGVDWANVGSPTTTVGLSGTTVKTATDVEADTADLQSRTPAALVSGRMDASVGAMAANVMTAAAAAADLTTELQSGLATAAALATVDTVVDAIQAKTDNLPSDPADASVIAGRFDTLDTSVADLPTNAELATALAAADDAVLTQVALVKAVTDKVDDTLEDDAGTFRFTANALEEAPTGGSAPTVGEIADAVWDEATAGHTTSGTFGEQVKTDVDAILADTNELQTDWVNGGRLDNILDARASQTSVDDLPTNAELATALAAADDAILAAIAALNNLSQANVRTAVGLASANLDTQLDALPTNAELATALGTADDAILAAIAALNNLSSAQAQTAAAAAITAAAIPAGVLTAAASNPISANLKEINDAALTGDGAGTPWGPA